MQLKKYTDFSLRALLYLALHPDKLVTIAEISRAFDVSNNHLIKIIHKLSTAGVVHSVRGKGGGIRLAHEPEDISIRYVVELMEDDLNVVKCNEPVCPIIRSCLLKGVLSEATEAFLATLDNYTLADVLVNERRLKRDIIQFYKREA